MEKATAVNSCLGVLKGRDCIYLDQVKQDALNNLTFTGDINGHLISQCRDEKDWFPYTLTFRQVLAYFTCELDTYENMAAESNLHCRSSRSIRANTSGKHSISSWYSYFAYNFPYSEIQTSAG